MSKPTKGKALHQPKKKGRKTPNCAVCKWRGDGSFLDYCSAQGDVYLSVCYNNDLCNSLFEVKTDENI